jgi:hypothetical protein
VHAANVRVPPVVLYPLLQPDRAQQGTMKLQTVLVLLPNFADVCNRPTCLQRVGCIAVGTRLLLVCLAVLASSTFT